ncbi:MAG: hypothetical protein ABJB95_07700 [Gemmatimonadales bacterium]
MTTDGATRATASVIAVRLDPLTAAVDVSTCDDWAEEGALDAP